MDRPRRNIKPVVAVDNDPNNNSNNHNNNNVVPNTWTCRPNKKNSNTSNKSARPTGIQQPEPPKVKQAWRTQGTPIDDSVRPEDVMLGRGPNVQQHKGNVYFRRLVQQTKARYNACDRDNKSSIGREICAMIASRGGRYVEQQQGIWCQVLPKRAMEKTCQALREKKWNNKDLTIVAATVTDIQTTTNQFKKTTTNKKKKKAKKAKKTMTHKSKTAYKPKGTGQPMATATSLEVVPESAAKSTVVVKVPAKTLAGNKPRPYKGATTRTRMKHIQKNHASSLIVKISFGKVVGTTTKLLARNPSSARDDTQQESTDQKSVTMETVTMSPIQRKIFEAAPGPGNQTQPVVVVTAKAQPSDHDDELPTTTQVLEVPPTQLRASPTMVFLSPSKWHTVPIKLLPAAKLYVQKPTALFPRPGGVSKATAMPAVATTCTPSSVSPTTMSYSPLTFSPIQVRTTEASNIQLEAHSATLLSPPFRWLPNPRLVFTSPVPLHSHEGMAHYPTALSPTRLHAHYGWPRRRQQCHSTGNPALSLSPTAKSYSSQLSPQPPIGSPAAQLHSHLGTWPPSTTRVPSGRRLPLLLSPVGATRVVMSSSSLQVPMPPSYPALKTFPFGEKIPWYPHPGSKFPSHHHLVKMSPATVCTLVPPPATGQSHPGDKTLT